jgi:glycine/D-amino acid oxidase-like deaminating enzyme
MAPASIVQPIGEQQVTRGGFDEWAWREGAPPLPQRADIVIVGGGIVGCSAAWQLARQGLQVVLFEKGRVAGEQSGRNWGWVRQQGRSPLELPLMIESLHLWRGLAAEIGEDVGFTQGGTLYLAENPAQLASLGEWLGVAHQFGLDTRVLTARELGTVLRGGEGRWAGALFTPSDGRAEPGRAAPAIARAAARAGARIVSQCAVLSVEHAAGRVHSVVTERGTVTTAIVALAAGAWTSAFCRSLGISFPQLRVKGTVARTAPADHILEGQAWSPHLAIRRRRDGGYTVAHGSALHHSIVPDTLRFARKFLPALRQEHGAIRLRLGREFFASRVAAPRDASYRMPDPPPDTHVLGEMREALQRFFPEIAAAPFTETWAGIIETSPDVLPVISPCESMEGFFVASGFSGHGFGIGPGAGALLARMVTGGASAAALAPFRLSRFFDGSPIVPGPTI